MSGPYYKTTYVVEILHNTPIPDDWDLKDVLEEAETGAYSGDVLSQETVEVDQATMGDLLEAQRSDRALFDRDSDALDTDTDE